MIPGFIWVFENDFHALLPPFFISYLVQYFAPDPSSIQDRKI